MYEICYGKFTGNVFCTISVSAQSNVIWWRRIFDIFNNLAEFRFLLLHTIDVLSYRPTAQHRRSVCHELMNGTMDTRNHLTRNGSSIILIQLYNHGRDVIQHLIK